MYPAHPGHANGGADSSDSRDVSRASSVDRDDGNSNSSTALNATAGKDPAGADPIPPARDPDDYAAVSSPPEPPTRRKPSRRAGSLLTNKRLKQSIKVRKSERERERTRTVKRLAKDCETANPTRMN